MGNILSVDRLLATISLLAGVRFSNSSGRSLTLYTGVSVEVLPVFRASFQIGANGEWSAGTSLGRRSGGRLGTVSVTGQGLSVTSVSGDVSMNLDCGVDLSFNAGITDIQNGVWSVGAGLGYNGFGIFAAVTGRCLSLRGISGGGSIDLGGVDLSLNVGVNDFQEGEWRAEGTIAAKDNGMSGTAALTGKGISVQEVSGNISNIETGPVNLSVGAGIDFEQGRWHVEGEVGTEFYRTPGGTAENQASVEEVSGESSTHMSDENLSRNCKRNKETLEDQLPLEEQPCIKWWILVQTTTRCYADFLELICKRR